jgi:arsenate reductase-like glutaredoxin family protein
MDSCEVNRGVRKLAAENPHAEKPKESEITAELLQNLGFELIATSEKLWRTYSENKDGKDQKIIKGMLGHQKIINAARKTIIGQPKLPQFLGLLF